MPFSDNDFYEMSKPNVKEMPCRTCCHAAKGGIAKAVCAVYDQIDINRKPKGVYFENEPCPRYEKGEDLLQYELFL